MHCLWHPHWHPHFRCCRGNNETLEHFFLRGSLRRTPRVRVVERHVHLAVPHDRLYYRGVFLFVHQASSQRMAKRVKAEALHDFAVRPVGDAVLFANHASTNCCWAKVILDQLRSASRLLASQLLRREREIVVIGIQAERASSNSLGASPRVRDSLQSRIVVVIRPRRSPWCLVYLRKPDALRRLHLLLPHGRWHACRQASICFALFCQTLVQAACFAHL